MCVLFQFLNKRNKTKISKSSWNFKRNFASQNKTVFPKFSGNLDSISNVVVADKLTSEKGETNENRKFLTTGLLRILQQRSLDCNKHL